MYSPGKLMLLESPKANKKHLSFIQLNRSIQKKGADYLLILKSIDDNYSVVARCLKNRKPGDWYFTIKIDGQRYYIAVKKFIKVPNCILIDTNTFLDNHNYEELIVQIYQKHQEFYKNKEINPKRRKEIELSKKYYSVYRTAIINNDLQTLKELKIKLGKDPTIFFSSSRNPKEKSAKLVSDNVFKPYHGGSFAPK